MSCDPAALIQQINELQYLEYTNIGWMKAELLNVEALGSQLPSTASVGLPALLDRFHCDLDDSAIHRELIAFFLENWVCYQTPESSCGDVPSVVETLDGLTCLDRIFFQPSGKRARRE